MTECDEIINVMHVIATKKANAIATNVTSTASINCYSKIVRDFYILYTVLLVTILLLIISIISYHCVKRYKIKWKIMNIRKSVWKIVGVIISMT